MDTESLRQRHYNATIIDGRIHHDTVMVIRVRSDRRIPQPVPGQWVELGLGAWEPVMKGAEPGSTERVAPDSIIRRAYSLSAPLMNDDRSRLLEAGEWEGFEFFLSLVVPPEERSRRVPNLTGRLFCLGTGDRLFMSDEPMGEYTLEPVLPEENVLFLATGTGEAPHNLMIWDLLRRRHRGRVASIVSVRYGGDLAYEPVHRRLAELFSQYQYDSITTRETDGARRHLQDLLRDGTMEQVAGFALDPPATRVYLCGNPGMIGPPRLLSGKRLYPEPAGLIELLEEKGFNADPRNGPVNVHYERYW